MTTYITSIISDLATNLHTFLVNEGVSSISKEELEAQLTTYKAETANETLKLSAVKPDFEQVMIQLQSALANKSAWKDIIPASVGQTILEFISAILVLNQRSIERAVQESMLDSARLNTSVMMIARMLGVHILRKRPAVVTVELTRQTTAGSLFIDKFSQFTVDGVKFFNRAPAFFNIGVATITIELAQGEIITEDFTSTGEAYQRFEIGNQDYTISDTDILCYVGEEESQIEYFRTIDGLWGFGATSAVFYENCQTGDTLIATELGLLRLDEISMGLNKFPQGTFKTINLKVAGRNAPQIATRAYYQGNKRTYTIVTDKGNELNSTGKHPNLILNQNTGDLEWRSTKKCKLGDLLCINPIQITRETPLALNLSDGSEHLNAKSLNKPESMSPKLAFILGLIVSEGTLQPYYVSVANNDTNLLQHYISNVEAVFGIDTALYTSRKAGTECEIQGVLSQHTKTAFTAVTSSLTLVQWLQQLGVYAQAGLKKKASRYKHIPWSILQADKESQLAFIAAYLEGDGSVNQQRGTLHWYSASKLLLQQMQLILNSHGYAPTLSKAGKIWRISLNRTYSTLLWHQIEPYMITKKLLKLNSYTSIKHGVPAKFWQKLLQKRLVSSRTNQGVDFYDDAGNLITVSLDGDDSFYRYSKIAKYYCYQQYKDGKLNFFLNILKRVSFSAYNKLTKLLNLEYTFTAIKKLSKGKILPVYDLAMRVGEEPAFVANGLIVHNTTPNGNVEIGFGNGIYGAIPPTNDTILFKYARTTGSNSNRSQTGLAVSYSGDSTIKGITTSYAANGDDERDKEFYRSTAPFIYAAHKRAVTRDDYRAIALEYPNVIDAVFRGQQEIAPDDRTYMNVIEATILTSSVWNESQWRAFATYMQAVGIYQVHMLRRDPQSVALDIEAKVYCKANTNLTTAGEYIRSKLVDAFKPKRGSLGYNWYLSDIAEILEGDERYSITVDYVKLIQPTVDIEINQLQYVVLQNVSLSMFYTDRA